MKAAPSIARAIPGAARTFAAASGPEALALGYVTPKAGEALRQGYEKGHSSFTGDSKQTPHPTTPGVTFSGSFDKLRKSPSLPATNSPALTKTTAAAPTTFQNSSTVGPDTAKFTGAKPAPAPAPASTPTPGDASKTTSTTTKSGFYKGGSQGDYTIKKGETLSGIAKSTGQRVADLAKMNNISDVNKISAGAKLMTKVPTPPSRPADTASASTAPAPTAAAPSVEKGGSSNPPVTSGNPTPSGGGAITQDAQKKQKTTQDAGTSSAPAPVAECVQIGDNKYRIV